MRDAAADGDGSDGLCGEFVVGCIRAAGADGAAIESTANTEKPAAWMAAILGRF